MSENCLKQRGILSKLVPLDRLGCVIYNNASKIYNLDRNFVTDGSLQCPIFNKLLF